MKQLPGQYLSDPRLLLGSQYINTPGGPVHNWQEGLGRLSKQLLGAYMVKQAADERDAANRAMVQGMTAKPWVNPDTGKAWQGQEVGGYKGGMTSLSRLEGNPYAGRLANQLALAGLAREQEVSDRDAKTRAATSAADLKYKRDLEIAKVKREQGLKDAIEKAMFEDSLARSRDRDKARESAGLPPLGPSAKTPATSAPVPVERTGTDPYAVTPDMSLPEAQARAAAQKKMLEERAKSDAAFMEQYPNYEATLKSFLTEINALRKHPGLSDIVGMPAWGGITSKIPYIGGAFPGTEAAGAESRLNQVKGRLFLEAYKTLKGGGQITEVEGRKAEQAMARLNTAQNEKDFNAALDDLEQAIRDGYTKMQSRAKSLGRKGMTPEQPRATAPSLPPLPPGFKVIQ